MRCFYEKGLQFTCETGCHYCCSCEPGFVFLSKEDLSNLCAYTALSQEQFIGRYCRKVNMGSFSMISLLEKDNFDCIFLTNKGCSVYEGRPKQCRTYPFWKNVLESEVAWNEEAKGCPGIGKGKRYTKEEIEQLLAVRPGQEPLMVR